MQKLYTKPNFIVVNSMKALSQAIRDHTFSFVEHQNYLTVSKKWTSTLFNIKFCSKRHSQGI